MRVIIVGSGWNGSDCTSLARGFREIGHLVEHIETDHFIPKTDRTLVARISRRLLTPFFVRQLNSHILDQARRIRPDIIMIFKGTYLLPETLRQARELTPWLCNFYPDVSVFGHNWLAPSGFQHYDHIITTKTFGADELDRELGLNNASFVPHGFDPAVHRPVEVPEDDKIDVSFIGTWSPHKERMLTELQTQLKPNQLKIWGAQWGRRKSSILDGCVVGHGVLGDFYAEAICRSRVNIALLYEGPPGARSGDLITSRTFHIPACGGFMLHQRSSEIGDYFNEAEEIDCFDSPTELIQKVKYYLNHESRRKEVAEAGHKACWKSHSLAHRAQSIIDVLQSLPRKD